MDWVKPHYTEQSRLFGRAAITAQHRQLAELLHAWCRAQDGCSRVLELGAGACGVAGAMVQLGYDVTAVEFNSSDLALAKQIATTEDLRDLRIVGADFYEVQLGDRFDFVYYLDGFGVGEDADQHRLLTRIGQEWLSEHGFAMIDVFSPWNWQRRDGEQRDFTAVDGSRWTREISFDAQKRRFRDFMRPREGGDTLLSQTIRLYSPQEFQILVEGTGLRVDAFYLLDGTPIDPASRNAETSTRLESSNGYYARLIRG